MHAKVEKFVSLTNLYKVGSDAYLISSYATFKPDIGYSRAAGDGDWIFVSDTTEFVYESMTISEDVAEQTNQWLHYIENTAPNQVGPSLADVVCARKILPRAGDLWACWPAVRPAFGEIRSAATMIAARLADLRWKIEIDVTAHSSANA